MRRLSWLLAAFTVVVGLVVSARLVAAQGESAAAVGSGPFGKKILAVRFVRGLAAEVAVLESVETKQLGGKWFLVGRGLDRGPQGDWYKSKKFWLPIDHAAEIIEFDTMEELEKVPHLKTSPAE